jgi:hypothetical protein
MVLVPLLLKRKCDFPSFSQLRDISNHALGFKMQGQNHNRPSKAGALTEMAVKQNDWMVTLDRIA